jgi:hypothetical protein
MCARLAYTSDRVGGGEHLTAGTEPAVRVAQDIAPDRIVGPEEAGTASEPGPSEAGGPDIRDADPSEDEPRTD